MLTQINRSLNLGAMKRGKESESKATPAPDSHLIRRHLQFAWWSLLVFLSVGIFLESMHGFKVGWYLEIAFETRRLMWTLAHAHGALLALVHAAFALTVYLLPSEVTASRNWASSCLIGASVLLPGGFFLGGIFVYEGDPGIGVFLVPFGALLLLIAVLVTAVGTSRLTVAPGMRATRKRSPDRRSGK